VSNSKIGGGNLHIRNPTCGCVQSPIYVELESIVISPFIFKNNGDMGPCSKRNFRDAVFINVMCISPP
jgi:hypothetical protein